MTSDELRTLILTNSDAKALAIDGRDEECAALIGPLMPWEPTSRKIGELGVLDLFPNPLEGEAAMQALESAAVSDSPLAAVVKRALKSMQPNAEGIDIGKANTRLMLDMLRDASVFTEEQHATLKRAGERQVTVSTADVSAALLPLRKEGKATQKYWQGD